jgi:hypothetical protein
LQKLGKDFWKEKKKHKRHVKRFNLKNLSDTGLGNSFRLNI